ncbi:MULTISPECIES: SET domain-containing protein [Bradyrhizobium]|uniref:hypothetical protein n=1 Tax=Bradyrhizobium TaxID=374 RepID=UPI001FD8958F|nr:hypothetical protein [Bradyrhizobium japonicum]WLB88359.1 hypothetical protein QIH91_38090 [Bradyrhizobium japonicum USDA 135]
MLIVDTILKPDRFGGIGLFSATRLPKGSLIWIHNPIVDITVTPEQYEALARPIRESAAFGPD